ncbi:hypothetical protein LIER_43253 [Lithospermum erythrorhizon]|uniref:U-box domain-containing protein n=1 Tax=Lithospermum erythrorhizon TaxID=34254 RepID=A0AAV3PQY9_LITER
MQKGDFRCPISLELMTNPITLSTGHTYDRSSILKWFATGNHTFPKTCESLVCIDLLPNVALKKLINLGLLGSAGNSREVSSTLGEETFSSVLK